MLPSRVQRPQSPGACRNPEPRLAYPGDALEAPGILRNPVPVSALFERDAAHEATLRNLLQRKGYRDLEPVWEAAGSSLTLHTDGSHSGP